MGSAVLLRALRSVIQLQTSQLQILGARSSSTQNALIGNAGQPKMEKISRSVKMYLERAKKYEGFMNEQNIEFEIGKRHLANIMGLDPETISQEEIDRAIEYLLPSGLFNKDARPKLKPPKEILPKFSAAQFGIDGRPFSSFFYTARPYLCENLYQISIKTEEVKAHEDQQLADGIKFDQSLQLLMPGSRWKTKEEIEKNNNEKMSEQEYKTLILALEHLVSLPYSFKEKDFIYQFRHIITHQTIEFQRQELNYDEEGRGYIVEEGTRKKAVAKVKLFVKGTGNVTINGELFLSYFPLLVERQQVLFPLHVVDKLLKVDIEAEVEGGGSSGQAGAIRLAVSKALRHIISGKDSEKLRLAGLLTVDPRTHERMKPGQPGARKKPTWKKR